MGSEKESPVKWEDNEECMQGSWCLEPCKSGFSWISGHHCGEAERLETRWYQLEN